MDIRKHFESNIIQKYIHEYLSSSQILQDLQNTKHLKNEHFKTFINEKYQLDYPKHPDISTALIGRNITKYEKQNPNTIFKKRTNKGTEYILTSI